jgi:predicted nucleic acid-binding protein
LIRYVDTSVLVAALTNEIETARMQVWLTEPSADVLAISDWTMTEFAAALSVKVRSGLLGAEDGRSARQAFDQLAAGSLVRLPVPARTFHAAARLADQHSSGLRAGDALHLAIAVEAGATLYTLDRRLAEAGTALGLAVVRL